jgi:hypothetical protein
MKLLNSTVCRFYQIHKSNEKYFSPLQTLAHISPLKGGTGCGSIHGTLTVVLESLSFSVIQLLFLCYILTYLAFGVTLRAKCFINRDVEARGLSKPGVGASAPRARHQKPPWTKLHNNSVFSKKRQAVFSSERNYHCGLTPFLHPGLW